MSSSNPTNGVGYVLRKFPVLSETFILNEILELEARGVPVHIFSLARSSDPRFHEQLSKLKASVAYVPEVFDLKTLLRQNKLVAKHTGDRYFRTLTYTLTRANPTLLWRFLQACFVANQARRLRLRHLHAHFATRPTSVAFLASGISGIPYSFTAHAMDIFREHLSRKALVKKIDKAQFVVTVSDFNKQYLEELARGDAEKIVRIYNGIDLTRFSPNGVSSPDPFTILCVARLVEKKGLPILIEACHQLHLRGLYFRCWIVGKGQMRSQLEGLIKQWNLQDHVYLLGPHTQQEVLERYHGSQLYVLPCVAGSDGNRDGLPVSIVEALACGLPVVTTPMTGIPEVVRGGHNGLLVRDGDARALADAIESVIRDTELYARLKVNTRPSVESNFDIRQTAEALQYQFEGGLL